MNTSREKKLEALGYELKKIQHPKAKYELLTETGNLLFSSGALPFDGDTLCFPGKVPSVVPFEKAKEMAALCAANIIRAVYAKYGSLDVVSKVVKMNGYVNSDSNFTEQHLVMNGASQLLIDVFGESGRHSRSALGVNMIPLNACVEVDIVFELTPR